MLILRRVLKPPSTAPLVVIDSLAQTAEKTNALRDSGIVDGLALGSLESPGDVESLPVRVSRRERPDYRAIAYDALARTFVTNGAQLQVNVDIEYVRIGAFTATASRAGVVDGYALFQNQDRTIELELIYE